MRLRTKVITLAVLAVLLASVGAVGFASAQVDNTYNTYDTTLIIVGNGQVTQPGTPINVGMQLFSGMSSLGGMTVKVYTQRLGMTSVFGEVIGRPASPVLVATVNPWIGTSVSFKQEGVYAVFAVFEGAKGPVTTDGKADYYRPSQSEKMTVKVTSTRTSLLMRKPTLTFATTNADQQVSFVGDSFLVGGQLRSFGTNSQLLNVEGKTLSVYCQYKRPDSDSWGAPVLIGKSVYENGYYGVQYKPTQPGYYRFQAKFAGDPVWRWGGFDASASNYVDVLVKTATPDQITQLSLDASTATPYTGEAISFESVLQTASTHTPIPNGKVNLQFSTDNVNWSGDLSKYSGDHFATTGGNGKCVITGSFDTPGVYYVRTVVFGTTEYTQAFSDSVKITVGLPPINPPS